MTTATPPTSDTRSAAGSVTLRGFELVLVAALAVLASATYRAFFSGTSGLAWVVAAVLLAVLAVAVGQWRGRSVTAALALATAGLLVLLVALQVGGDVGNVLRPATYRELAVGLVHGWSRMLTVALPADPTPDLLVTPVVVAWGAGLAGALAVLRTEVVLLPLLGPLVAYVVALALTAAVGGSGFAVLSAFVVVSLLLVLLRANRVATSEHEGISVQAALAVGVDLSARRLHSTLGRVAFGLPVVAVVGALAVGASAASAVAPSAHRADPRRLRPPPVVVQKVISPLVTLKSDLTASPRSLFTVDVDAPSTVVDRVRLASLDGFDGALWSVTGSYVRTGHRLPAAAGQDAPTGHLVTQTVTITGLQGPFLPAAGRPVTWRGSGSGFDPVSGMLVTPRQRLRGYRYTVTSVVPPAGDRLAQATPQRGQAADLALPSPPSWLAPVLAEATGDALTPVDQLKRLEAWMRALPYDLRSPPGESYGDLRRVLTGTDAVQRGSFEEQRAAAFVVLARSMHLPARVAVGYVLDPKQRRGTTYTVTTADVRAWPEVLLAGVGWASFDPTDRKVHDLAPPPPDQRQEGGAVGHQRQRSGADTSLPAVVLTPPTTQPPHRVATAVLLGFVAAGLVALLVASVVATVAGKALRRLRRRRVKGTAPSVLAAWRQVTDELRDAGVIVSAASTPAELARESATGLGTDVGAAVAALAPLVAHALYAPEPPEPDVAAAAWRLERRVRRDLARRLGWWGRLQAATDPRSLLPRPSWPLSRWPRAARPRWGAVTR